MRVMLAASWMLLAFGPPFEGGMSLHALDLVRSHMLHRVRLAKFSYSHLSHTQSAVDGSSVELEEALPLVPAGFAGFGMPVAL